MTAAVMAKDEWILDLLLRSGWEIDESLGLTTPLALALAVEDSALVSWFLERGASPNAQCALDLTPLSVAVEFSSLPIIRSLFDHGGSVLYGQLLHYAVRRDLPDQADVLDLILGKQPQINHVMYQEHPSSYFSQRMFGLGTPLHEAAERGKSDVVRKLVEAGSHPLIKDSCGEIPLQRAQMMGRDFVVASLGPFTASAEWPARQFTEGKETTGWS
nr:putative ankyrin repeat protein [Quercus suber]